MTPTTNNQMVNVMTQTDYPYGEYHNGIDIPEYISIYERPKTT